MGDDLREGDVQAGDVSILEYQLYRDAAADPQRQDEAAQRLASLADYNHYDCRSTIKLRDWLLDRAADAGVRDAITARSGPLVDEPDEADDSAGHPEDSEPEEPDTLHASLLEKAGEDRAARSAEQQAYAMTAAALAYHQREEKPFWWAHFHRLATPLEDWGGQRDIFVVEEAEVVEEWAVPGGRARNPRRRLRLTGEWGAGTTIPKKVVPAYAAPGPASAQASEKALFGAAPECPVAIDEEVVGAITIEESCKPDGEFEDVPAALMPSKPPNADVLKKALRAEAERLDETGTVPRSCGFDVLARRTPRLRDGAALSQGEDVIDAVVASLLAMDNSYVAVQGPPGTGKTYSGSRIVKRLVEEHGWRVGVVAQSHTVVENMLGGIVGAG